MTIIRNELDRGIICLKLSRPEVYNAINTKLLLDLNDELNTLENSNTVRAIIFTGEGEKSFCAGADLKERAAMSNEDTLAFVKLISSTMRRIYDFPIPTIAAINGVAFGGGMELALACDIRLALVNASMGLTECALGIIPGAGGTQLLPKLIGPARAKEMIFMGKRLSAKEAYHMGILNALIEDSSDFLQKIQDYASKLTENAPLAIRAAKQAINQGFFADGIEAGFELEHKFYNTILHTEDRLEALNAFVEKRKPIFKGV